MIDAFMWACLGIVVAFGLLDIVCIVVIRIREKERKKHENYQSRV